MYKKYLKRILDIIASITLLAFFWPLMLLIALAIKFDSNGPVFYKQRRYNGVHDTFMVYKFRTMKVGARKRMRNQGASPKDMITGIGKVLRELHIDELPNVINILKGDMSFIGVRPQQTTEQKACLKADKNWKKRFEGSVGAVSLERLINIHPPIMPHILKRLKNSKSLKKSTKRIDFDLYYAENESLYTDSVVFAYLVKITVSKFMRVLLKRDFREYKNCDAKWKNRKLF